MFTKQFTVGGDRNYAYLVADKDSRKALVIDPSYSPQQIVDFAKENGYEIEYVFCTHNHFDHTNGNDQIESLTGKTPLVLGDIEASTEIKVENNAVFPLGGLDARIIHTPGHTPESMCIYVGDAVYTGDTLFVGKVGGTGFGKDAEQEFHSLHEKLFTLPDETCVFPGHNYGTAPESTIGHERQTNPFMQQPDLESFIYIKKNWAAYKVEHGIT